jgi:uncharacterized protein YaaN involved in tellurite resistance
MDTPASKPQNTSLAVIKGSQGQIQLASKTMPDVRELLTVDDRREARKLALTPDLLNTRAIIKFGIDQVPMSELAKRIAANAKVKETRGTPIEEVLVDLGAIKKQFDPAQLIAPSLRSKLIAAIQLKGVVEAYVQNWSNMDKQLDDMALKLERAGDMQDRTVQDQQTLGEDALTLYDHYTLVEAACKYLLQRLDTEYGQREQKLQPNDLRASTELATVGDNMGYVDRTALDLHQQRAKTVEVAMQTKIIGKSDEELLRMLTVELSIKFPLFRIQMAMFIELLRSKKTLEFLQKYRVNQAATGDAIRKAMSEFAIAVADESGRSTAEAEQMVAGVTEMFGLIDTLQQKSQAAKQARQTAEQTLDSLIANMQSKVVTMSPKDLTHPVDTSAIDTKLVDPHSAETTTNPS